MTFAQLEHAPTLADPPPEQDTFDRMEELITARRREIIITDAKKMQLDALDRRWPEPEAQASDRRRDLVDQLAQSESRLARVAVEIIEVAGLICAEYAAAKMETT